MLELNLALQQLEPRRRGMSAVAASEPSRPRRGEGQGQGPAAGLPGRRPRGRQDRRHALRGPPPGRPRHRRGDRHRARPTAGSTPPSRSATCRSIPRRVTSHRGVELVRDGHRRGAGPAPRGGAGRRAGAHQRPRLGAREALAGRRSAPRRGDRRDHHGEHPAPGIAQRRGRRDHRHQTGRDRARPGGPGRRADRTGRHDPAGAAPADGARAHLPGGTDRHRAGQLLPGGQPHRAAGTGAALGRRPGRGGPGPVPGRTRHQGHLGRPGPDRGRADRRPGRGDAAPPRRPDRRPGRRPVTDRRCTSCGPTAPPRRRRPRSNGNDCWSRTSAAACNSSSATTSPRPCWNSPGRSTAPRSSSAPPGTDGSRSCSGPAWPTPSSRAPATSTSTWSPTPAPPGHPDRGPAFDGRARARCGPGAPRCCCPSCWPLLLLPWRGSLGLSTVLLIFLLGVLGNALIGGVLPAAVAAVIAGLLANYLFTPPVGSFTITQPENAFALVVFVVVGVTVASVVDRSALRARQAARGRSEAQLVAAAATSVLNSTDPVHAVLEQARVGFGMRSVLLAVDHRHRDRRVPGGLQRRPRRRRPRPTGRSTRTPPTSPSRPVPRSRAGSSRCTGGRCRRRTSDWCRCSPPRRCWPSTGNG